jgi:hypothetical protein
VFGATIARIGTCWEAEAAVTGGGRQSQSCKRQVGMALYRMGSSQRYGAMPEARVG